jgi:hypothetical protein
VGSAKSGSTITTRAAAVRSMAMLPPPGRIADPVLKVVLERVRCGSRPGSRDDDHVVCLAVEAAGCVRGVGWDVAVLEAAGLVLAFDRFIACRPARSMAVRLRPAGGAERDRLPGCNEPPRHPTGCNQSFAGL